MYSIDNLSCSLSSVQIFQGNTDRYHVVTHRFVRRFKARVVRIHVRSFKSAVSMRVELYGCRLGKIVCLSVCLSICLSVCLSCYSICLSVCLVIRLACLSVCLSVYICSQSLLLLFLCHFFVYFISYWLACVSVYKTLFLFFCFCCLFLLFVCFFSAYVLCDFVSYLFACVSVYKTFRIVYVVAVFVVWRCFHCLFIRQYLSIQLYLIHLYLYLTTPLTPSLSIPPQVNYVTEPLVSNLVASRAVPSLPRQAGTPTMVLTWLD